MATPAVESQMLLLSDLESRLRTLELLVDAKSIGETLLQAEKEDVLLKDTTMPASTASSTDKDLPLMTHVPAHLLGPVRGATQTTLLAQVLRVEQEVASITSKYPELTALSDTIHKFNQVYGVLDDGMGTNGQPFSPERLQMMKDVLLSSLDDISALKQSLMSVQEKEHILGKVSSLLSSIDIDSLTQDALKRRATLDAQLREAKELQHILDTTAMDYSKQVYDASAKMVSWSRTLDILEADLLDSKGK